MPEKGPVPISQGLEIQKQRVENFQRLALEQYRHLTILSSKLERRIDTALRKLPSDDVVTELAILLEQKHAIELIGNQLEEFILGKFEQLDSLQERWEALEHRMEGLPPDSDTSS